MYADTYAERCIHRIPQCIYVYAHICIYIPTYVGMYLNAAMNRYRFRKMNKYMNIYIERERERVVGR